MGCRPCIEQVGGNPVGGGGGPAPAAAGWQTVYEVDFRDAFASLGAVDLNSIGTSFTFEGVTWTTPTIANFGADQVAAVTSWGLTANGLEVVGVNGGFRTASTVSMPSVFANLADLAANSATAFDGDPTRKYLLQAFVSAGNANLNQEESGVGLYKFTGVPAGGFSTAFATFGQNAGVADIPSFLSGNTGSPVRFDRADLIASDHNTPTLHYAGTGKAIDGYAAPFAATWPGMDELRFIASYGENTEVDNDTPGDPISGWRALLGHAGGVASGYNAVIQQFRIRQL